ncbi:MAG: efflux RND transporter periplasmic adaptor subunit [Bacteroidetes bacterium]|nr:efflux RND transporter periplasmic adaptor subunit [Bacteroidota bacterium]
MKKWITALVVLVVLGGAGYWYYTNRNTDEGVSFRFVDVERGDVESVVASTGTLEAVTTVQVGTQVSGIVSAIYVDFNDKVKKGQVVAKIDTTLLASSVRDSEANLERNKAQLRQAEREFERVKNLFDQKFVSEQEYNAALFSLESAQAATKSAEINLQRSRQNLSYATIYAPISGTVIERNVDVGQTVAASLSAPQLFLIANDLRQMQILANVDESDIGQIKEDGIANFTVQAYPDDKFEGTVRQVRMQSTMQENVVNYSVVVDVDNSDGRLLPGMTATVDFRVEKSIDVLKVPNAALRFTPPQDMMAAAMERMRARFEQNAAGRDTTRRGNGGAAGVSGRNGGAGGAGGFAGFGAPGARRSTDRATLWYVDPETNELAMTMVRTGVTDGQSTEITGRNIEEGMKVISGIASSSAQVANNPFQQNSGGSRGPRGAF